MLINDVIINAVVTLYTRSHFYYITILVLLYLSCFPYLFYLYSEHFVSLLPILNSVRPLYTHLHYYATQHYYIIVTFVSIIKPFL